MTTLIARPLKSTCCRRTTCRSRRKSSAHRRLSSLSEVTTPRSSLSLPSALPVWTVMMKKITRGEEAAATTKTATSHRLDERKQK